MEIDYEKLKELGINIADRDYTKSDPQKMLCPSCKSSRKKHKKNKPLAVYWKDCYAKCFNCGDSFFFGKTEKLNDGQPPNIQPMKQKSKEYKKPGKLANEEPLDENMRKWFEQRGIPTAIAEAEGIFRASRKMPQTGNIENCIVFPYTVDGELVNRKYRDGAKNFMLESGAKLVPWRIDRIKHSLECIITEGEMDALSFLVADILGVINLELKTPLSATKVGMLLNKMGFRKVRKDNRRGYKVYRYSVEEISHNKKGTVNDAEEQVLPF